MPTQGSIVCPDCGAAYQCKPEQIGKLLHCKCGRYLVAGSNNQKTVTDVKPPGPPTPTETTFGIKAPASSTEPTFGLKAVAPVPPKTIKPEPAEKTNKEAQPARASEPSNSKNLILAGTLFVIVAVAALGYVFFRPSVQANSTKPNAVEAPVQATATVVDPCTVTPMRLENGASVAHSRLGNGMGKLEIENGTPSDVAVRVTGSANLTIAWVYVQQGQKAMIDNIPLGSHHVLVASGSNWDVENLTFKCNDGYAAVDSPLDYTDRREDDRTTYNSYKLLIGKQRSTMISKSDYFKGHMGQ